MSITPVDMAVVEQFSWLEKWLHLRKQGITK
jgi:hypothetical protein